MITLPALFLKKPDKWEKLSNVSVRYAKTEKNAEFRLTNVKKTLSNWEKLSNAGVRYEKTEKTLNLG